jgi:Ras-related protein Rab-11A
MNFLDNKKEDFDHVIKVILIGDSGVGKTNIISRLCKDEFLVESKSTVGVEFASKLIELENKKVIKMQIWDTAGQERYKAITNTYYYRSQGAVVVFDITKVSSFKNVDKWVTQMREHAGPDVTIVLVGNKSDLKSLRAITVEEALDKAASLGNTEYIETSALHNSHINDAFSSLVKSTYYLNKEYTSNN